MQPSQRPDHHPPQGSGPPTGAVYFLEQADAAELRSALTAEGYQVSEGPCEGPGRARWALQVTPDDDGLVAMVDVYGGWLDQEA